jgi:hypothetical protein
VTSSLLRQGEGLVIRSIAERQQFACPAGAAQVFVERDFELHQSREQRVSLHVRVPVYGSLSLDKVVDVVLARSASSGPAGRYAMDVAWEPAGGPFPRFRGTLCVEPVGDETCILGLAGWYEPPGGLVGAVFDGLLGHRIARATLHDLVARIGRSVASEYERRVRSAVI